MPLSPCSYCLAAADTASISSSSSCPSRRVFHPKWLALYSHRNVDCSRNDTTYISYGENPLVRLLQHNRTAGYICGSKCTKCNSPYWYIEMLIGPFHEAAEAKAFLRAWRQIGRKVWNRIYAGCMLAKACKWREVLVYTRDVQKVRMILASTRFASNRSKRHKTQ